MALPDRPVDGAEIATDWGQEVHDRTFAPSGCAVRGNATQSCGTTPAQLQMDTVIDDPGGFLDAPNDQVVIPTTREGLYIGTVTVDAVNGTASTTQTRAYLLVNGVTAATGLDDNAGATHVTIVVPFMLTLSAGDILTVNGQRRGSGSNPDVKATIIMARIGAELGA